MASPLLLSIAILAALALTWGGGRLIFQRRDRYKGGLMIVAALVLLANVLIASWPLPH